VQVVHIATDETIRAAAVRMRKSHVGCLVAIDPQSADQVPVGILTDRDIVLAVVAASVDPEAVTVADVMSRNLACCREYDDVLDALRIMHERGIRRLPVTDGSGKLTGIVAADDICAALGAQLAKLGRALTRGQPMRDMQLRNWGPGPRRRDTRRRGRDGRPAGAGRHPGLLAARPAPRGGSAQSTCSLRPLPLAFLGSVSSSTPSS